MQSNVTGPAGAAGTRQTGVTARSWAVTVEVGDWVGDQSGSPSVFLSSVGAADDSGVGEGSPTGNGGTGSIFLDIYPYAGVSSGSTAAVAVSLVSTGGNGGTSGQMPASTGYPGLQGAGGNGNTIRLNQAGTVLSTHGWSAGTPGTTTISLMSSGGNGGEPTGGVPKIRVRSTAPWVPSAATVVRSITTSAPVPCIAAQIVGNVVVMQTSATQGTYTGYFQGVVDELAHSTGTQNSVTIGSNQTWDEKYKTIDECRAGDYGYAACGAGGTATVSTSFNRSVTTTRRNAHGVLAQSIGGGGGWVVGLTEASDPFNKPISSGAGGDVNLTLAGTIITKGDGAYGVLAQSVGAGGDLTAATTTAQFSHSQFNGLDYARSGDGGNVSIDNSGSISTTGNNAHAVFAQSVGGGGSLYATTSGLLMGTAGGEGDAGVISIANSGTIKATGSGSSAIYVDT